MLKMLKPVSNPVTIMSDGDADSGVDESTQAAEQAAETSEPSKRPTTSRIPRTKSSRCRTEADQRRSRRRTT